MFERFVAGSRQVVVLAQEEARRLHHPSIGTEHLLLGLLVEGHGPAARALSDRGLRVEDLRERIVRYAGRSGSDLDEEALAMIGIDLDEVRRATEASFGPGALDPRRKPLTGHIPFSKRAKKVLELSLREALALKHNYIDTGHILLGLLREGEGMAALVLVDAGVDLSELRAEVIRLITAEAA
ncbi:MAG: NDP-hexose 4-ketoreductase [Actinomycetia bacterium]|nr:NDP-hexose 4-ketoreductase [Actinomycetes bacterium]